MITFTCDMRFRLFDLRQGGLVGNGTVRILTFISDTDNL